MHRVYTDPDSTNRSGIAYSGDLRYIDGVPLRSTADFDCWRVINGRALSIRNHIQDLERQFTDGKDLEAQKHFEESVRTPAPPHPAGTSHPSESGGQANG